MRQGSVELFERPIYFAAGDHQGWTNTDGVIVGVLAQDAATAQRVAVAPGAASVRVKLDGDHQAAAAHLFHGGGIDVAQAGKEARPHHASVFDHAFFDEDLERSAGDGASERVAAESTAVLAPVSTRRGSRCSRAGPNRGAHPLRLPDCVFNFGVPSSENPRRFFAKIALLGNYVAANFVMAADGAIERDTTHEWRGLARHPSTDSTPAETTDAGSGVGNGGGTGLATRPQGTPASGGDGAGGSPHYLSGVAERKRDEARALV